MKDWIGKVILNYEVLEIIGQGGMGVVLKGRHIHLASRFVAIKVLSPSLITNPEVRERFRNEAMTLSMLSYPNIVKLYDYYEDPEGNAFLIMEYVEGISLQDFIHKENGPLTETQIQEYFTQILDGFHYAHEQGIIHRDVKPSNILITPDGKTKILDFGIAKVLSADMQLTKTGTRMGTILYMSPEQVLAKKIDRRSDIYSLGVVLFEAVTGKLPYPTENVTEYQIYQSIVKDALPSVETIYPNVPKYLSEIINKATQKDPDKRFQNCTEFKKAIQEKRIAGISPFASTQLIADSLEDVLDFGEELGNETEKTQILTSNKKTEIPTPLGTKKESPKRSAKKTQTPARSKEKNNKKYVLAGGIFVVIAIISGILMTFQCPLFNVAGKSEETIEEFVRDFYRDYDAGNISSLQKYLGDGKYYTREALPEEQILQGIRQYKNKVSDEKHIIHSVDVHKGEDCSAIVYVNQLYSLKQKDETQKYVWSKTKLLIQKSDIVEVMDKDRFALTLGEILRNIKKELKGKRIKIKEYEIKNILLSDTLEYSFQYPVLHLYVNYEKQAVIGYKYFWYGKRPRWGIMEGEAEILVTYDPNNSAKQETIFLFKEERKIK